MEEINEELEQKEVERVKLDVSDIEREALDGDVLAQQESDKNFDESFTQPEPPRPAPKPKRQRTQKQIEAFEKARIKRAENIAKKKKEKEENKGKRKTKIVEEPSVIDSLPQQKVEELKQRAIEEPPPSEVKFSQPPPAQHQVINNYYYGSEFKDALTRQNSVAQPKGNNVKPSLRSSRTKLPQQPNAERQVSESESESDEEYAPAPPREEKSNTLKYRFV